MKWSVFFLSLQAGAWAISINMPSENSDLDCPAPWFTGPLITPSAHVVPKGYVNIEPYFFYISRTGEYDNHWKGISTPLFTRARFLIPTYIGLTSWSDILITPSATWNVTKGASTLNFNDLSVQFDIQLIESTATNAYPALKVYIGEVFPTGQFEKLDPERLETDSGGEGSFRTRIGATLGHLIEFSGCHWLSWRLNAFASIPTHVKVHGLNAYGGALNTKATVKPGIGSGAQFGLEYNLTRHWALANDVQILYESRTKFSGFAGTHPDGSPAQLGNPPTWQFSLAPAFEYNFNESWGLLAGAFFSFAGRNAPRFASGSIAINYFGPLKKGPRHAYRFSGGAGSGGR